MDSRWKYLKAYVPQQIKAREGKLVSRRLHCYAMSYQWRSNVLGAGKSLWAALGELVQQGSK